MKQKLTKSEAHAVRMAVRVILDMRKVYRAHHWFKPFQDGYLNALRMMGTTLPQARKLARMDALLRRLERGK